MDHRNSIPEWRWQFTNSGKIHKIPKLLRQEAANSDFYDPKVVSFGPYHWGKPELGLCESAKPFTVKLFLQGSSLSQEFVLSKILENIGNVRSSYMEEEATAKYSDKDLAEMMLLDASFIMFFIGLEEGHMEMQYEIWNFMGQLVLTLVNRDIFLLENQIPYQVITLLISLRYGNDGMEKVIKFLHESIWGHYKSITDDQKLPDANYELKSYQLLIPPVDLFEGFRRVLVWDPSLPNQEEAAEQTDEDHKKRHVTFRSAKDLKAKGIKFKPSSSKTLMGVSFAQGRLQLPTWFVSVLSKVFFPNMIAYEMCPNNLVETTVISYVNFMKKLIECPGDVKELRENRILITSLGSDEEVVKFYRSLNTYGVSDSRSYAQAKQRIQHHYDSTAKTWMAELKHTYLNSPWSFIGWFAGVFLLLLTFTQTYYAVFPNKR